MSELGPYRLGPALGSGGMGEVYHARDTRTGAEVALKVLRVLDPELLERFRREVELVREIEHPHLVRVLDAALAPPRPYAAFELVEGETLAQRVERAGPLPPAEAAQVIAALATGVAAVHERGLLHRDIKPANVLLGEGGPKLADFGLVREVTAATLTESGVTLGTPSYLAPEQIGVDKAHWGESTDVYGLAGTLYYALTGQPPFAGKTTVATLRQVLEAPPPSARERVPAVPPWLDAVCRRGLAKLGAERYPSALALRAALLEGGPEVGAPPVRAAWLAGAAAALALIGLAFVWAGTRGRASGPLGVEEPESPVEGFEPDLAPEALAAQRALTALEQQVERLAQAGELEEAEALLTRHLGSGPRRPGPALCMRGVVRLRRGDLEGAAEDLERAVDLQPGDGKVWLARARLRFAQGGFEAALADLRRAQELEPEDPTPWLVQAERLRLATRYAEALEAYQAAQARGADGRRIALGRALALGAQGDVDGALATLDAAIAAAESGGLLFARGQIYLAQKRQDLALADLTRAFELDPGEVQVGEVLVDVLLRQGRLEEALARAEQVSARSPDAALAHALRADVLGQLGRFVDAVAASDRSLRLDPGGWRAQAVRGRALQALGGSREALPDLDAALGQRPRSVPLRAARAAAHQALGDLALAQRDVDALIELEPEKTVWRLVRGQLRLELGDFAGALTDARAAGGELEAAELEAASLLGVGRAEEALEAYGRALRAAPEDAGLWIARAKALQALGRLEPALVDAERACALDSSWESQALRGRLLLALGRSAEAEAALRAAMARRTGDLIRIAAGKRKANEGDLEGALEDLRQVLGSGAVSAEERARLEALVRDLEARRAR
ncbi:MAG: protein kinase [Planctomycetota bacterium]